MLTLPAVSVRPYTSHMRVPKMPSRRIISVAGALYQARLSAAICVRSNCGSSHTSRSGTIDPW
jgi:hypothetical protein